MGVALYAGIASAAAGIFSGIQQGRAAKDQAEAQREAALKSEELGLAFVGRQLGALGDLESSQQRALDRFAGSFVRTPNATEFIDDAIDISQQGFDFMTGLKRENLEFVLGESGENLRQAQSDFAAIGAGDFSAFERELNASLSRAGQEAFGSPVGTTFNIAARDRFNFRTAGLNESLKIGDFFSREGTVDPPDPIPSAFELANFEQRENERKQRFDEFLFLGDTGISGANFDRRQEIETTGLLAQTNTLQALGNLGGANAAATASQLGALSGGLSSISGILQNRNQQQQDQQNFDRFIDAIGGGNRQANFVG